MDYFNRRAVTTLSLFIQQIFVKYLLCIRHCSGHSSKWKREGPHLGGAEGLCRGDEQHTNKQV